MQQAMNINVNNDEFDPSIMMSGAAGQGGYYDPNFYDMPPDGTMHVPQQIQAGGGVYPPTPTGGEYYDAAAAAANLGYGSAPPDAVYYEQQYSPNYTKTINYNEAWNHQQDHLAETTCAPPLPGAYLSVGTMMPQLFGAPVGAIAFDNAVSAIYVASPTHPMSQGRRWNHRASMLVTHNTMNGMLYSSVAGHPEATDGAIQAVYQTIYGVTDTNAASQPTGRRHLPPHAYKPPYGSSTTVSTVPDLTAPVGVKGNYHIGINSLLPLSGHVASVSPSAVRVHAHGGLQVADQNIEGMICGTFHPKTGQNQMATHVVVGGIPYGGNRRHIHCMDIWQGLRVVSSRTFNLGPNSSDLPYCGVTAIDASHSRSSIVAGCSDGQIRVLDDALRELATIKSHSGGVTSVAVSNDGKLIATTGFGSRPASPGNSSLYAFPDPNVFIYDIRYLGRGGVPHPFAGLRGGPRFLSFTPDMEGQPPNRLLVASGLAGGGLQIITPFETKADNPSNFISPQLDRGEYITAMTSLEDDLALGTSTGRLLKYKLAGYEQRVEKQPLEMPSFIPPLPPVSIESTILLSENPNVRNGVGEKVKSIFTAYSLRAEPTLTSVDPQLSAASLGPMIGNVVAPNRKHVSKQLMSKGSCSEGEVSITIPTSNMQLNLLHDHSTSKGRMKKNPLQNPNKLLYNKKLMAMCYDSGVANKRINQKLRNKGSIRHAAINQDHIPLRYRLNIRPSFTSVGTFDYTEFNNTGLLPGWDYPPTMPNAFASPILLLLYFNPTIRSTILATQHNERLLSSTAFEKSLVLELGFLFHQIESLSKFALSYPSYSTQADSGKPRLGAWVPSNFLASLASMPEADQLQILDGSPAAVETPRRPEAFYRFLLYQLDKELSKISEIKVMDSLHGVDFVSSNEFISGSGPPSHSSTRGLTVDLSYDAFLNTDDPSTGHCFGQVLQHALCRETRLRAWNQSSRSYETIVQRKIATSLPDVLSLSCACAGRKEEDGLSLWRKDFEEEGHWLPEIVEVELEESGDVVVRELFQEENSGSCKWETYRGRSPIPSPVSKLVTNKRSSSTRRKCRYQLEAVVAFLRTDVGESGVGIDHDDDDPMGHHILHMRIPQSFKRRHLMQRRAAVKNIAKELSEKNDAQKTSQPGLDAQIFNLRSETLQKQIDTLKDNDSSDWVLFNGFVVSGTNIDDARAFHVAFKEPCLIVYKAISDINKDSKSSLPSVESNERIPPNVMQTKSITNGEASKFEVPNPVADLPRKGDLIAFDAEFVSVQEEESTLTETGTKVTLRETRHAVGRISVLDCKTRRVIIDDHVLPQEPVVDYLTRFSGIVAKDLDPRQSPHHLISSQSAYLKLRYLMERGCIFVGHGLCQDFGMVNLVVPKHQVIDTLEIFHQDHSRYISLRFLANYVLGRDMQQNTHDSVEDAIAAYELYLKSLKLRKNGTFDKFLNELYEYGQKTDWKLGVDQNKS